MYQRILVPSDGSEGAEAAFEHALDLAALAEAELHVMHAVDPTMVPMEVGDEALFDSLNEVGEGIVDDLRERAEAAGIPVETAVLIGPVFESINDYTAEHDIDLLVLGTHGRTGIHRWLLGSVTERVVRTAEVPVLTIRAKEP